MASNMVETGVTVEIDEYGYVRTIGDAVTVYIDVPAGDISMFPGNFEVSDMVVDDAAEWKVVATFPVDPALPHPVTWDEVAVGPGVYTLSDVGARGAGASRYPDENAGWAVLRRVDR